MNLGLSDFIRRFMMERDRVVPARIQAALALLERLRECPSLSLDEHLTKQGGAGLVSHETFGNRALERLSLQPINRNHGRRSSNLPAWGQELLNALRVVDFEVKKTSHRDGILDVAQRQLASPLREMLEAEPISVRIRGKSIESVVNEVLFEAERRGKSGDVAQYLVGAKLMMRLERTIPIFPANQADRKSYRDPEAKLGDFEIADSVIEVAIGPPDPKHLAQTAEALENHNIEVWLLTRSDRVSAWRNEFDRCERIDERRVVVQSVEAFIGQNITEMAAFSAEEKEQHIKRLFDIYNKRWVETVGTPGIRLDVKLR